MWFSLEQCGLLLRDAVNLYEGGSDATAVGLAMLAREEMGKARILRDLWRDLVNNDRQVDGDEVRKKLGDHENKQAQSADRTGVEIRARHARSGPPSHIPPRVYDGGTRGGVGNARRPH